MRTITAGQRAADAIAANPERSDRSIARELGIDKDTVNRAGERLENSGGGNQPTDKRLGKDGKSYPAKPAAARTVVRSNRDGPRETPACVERSSPRVTPPEPLPAPESPPESLPAIEPDQREREARLRAIAARARG
jgi:DNA-binding transcriptional MocR family regulator